MAQRAEPAQHRAYRNTTEAINAVMYSLLTEFRDGDNVVTTMMEHNSNYVPWYAHVPRDPAAIRASGRVPYRPVRPSDRRARPGPPRRAGRPPNQARLLHRGVELPGHQAAVGPIRRSPTQRLPTADGSSGSLLLVDGAQLVPSSLVDVQALDIDYLAFSFHKVLAPFGVGVLYAKERLLAQARPFLYGGDMIAEGRVAPDRVEYNDLPWKYAAGTPNILGVIVSAQALRLLLDLVGVDGSAQLVPVDGAAPVPAVAATMDRMRSAHRRS